MSPKKNKKKSKTDGLSRGELKLISDLLNRTSEELIDNGCDDYNIPATDENKQIILDMFEDSGNIDDQEIEEVKSAKDEIVTVGWLIVGYLANRCKNLAEKK